MIRSVTKSAFVTCFTLALALSGGAAHAETKVKVLTPQEKKEKEYRKACKIKMCNVLRTKKVSGEEIGCHIIKSWREEDIKEMVTGGSIGWRWGRVYCEFNLKLNQQALADAVTKPTYDLKIASHAIKCDVDKKNGEKYKLSVSLAPEMKFENGKAVSGRMNWGAIDGPTLIKPLIWAGVKSDNQINFVGQKLAPTMNDFMATKCDQVKDELATAK